MIIKKIKSINEQLEFSKKYPKIKTIIEETIEAKDANLKSKDKVIQLTPKTKKKLKDNAKITPRYVATPLPPLNFNQTGKMCPIKQINAE